MTVEEVRAAWQRRRADDMTRYLVRASVLTEPHRQGVRRLYDQFAVAAAQDVLLGLADDRHD